MHEATRGWWPVRVLTENGSWSWVINFGLHQIDLCQNHFVSKWLASTWTVTPHNQECRLGVFCQSDVKLITSERRIPEQVFFRERCFSSVKDKEKLLSPMRNQTSDLWILSSNVPPLSHRDSMASKAHYKGSPLWTFVGYHTQMFCLNEGSQKLSFDINWLLESGRSGLCMGQ